MNSMEERILRFYNLHNNKWFHIMNWTLDVIRAPTKERKRMIIYYAREFYF
jgi:hypothetical protein